MDRSRQLIEALPTVEERAAERAERMRRACAMVVDAFVEKAPERLTPHTLAALAAGELSVTEGVGYSSPLIKGKGGRA